MAQKLLLFSRVRSSQKSAHSWHYTISKTRVFFKSLFSPMDVVFFKKKSVFTYGSGRPRPLPPPVPPPLLALPRGRRFWRAALALKVQHLILSKKNISIIKSCRFEYVRKRCVCSIIHAAALQNSPACFLAFAVTLPMVFFSHCTVVFFLGWWWFWHIVYVAWRLLSFHASTGFCLVGRSFWGCSERSGFCALRSETHF